ncbi:hypothetical protein [Clostridium sp. UBA3887]|uniref:hypothetical protein n=1 Tax=Clostridium sp. UBA3887 TaxID=1946356 RepID=UPI003217F3B3
MNEKKNYYKYSTFLLLIGIIIALSWYTNQDAINLFSIITAVVSIILAIYSLFTSNDQNKDTRDLNVEIKLLNERVISKLDSINDKIKLNIDGKSYKADSADTGATIYVEHIDFENPIKVNSSDFEKKLVDNLSAYNKAWSVIEIKILNFDDESNSITLILIINSVIKAEIISEIVQNTSRESNVFTNINGYKLVSKCASTVIYI